MTHIEGDLCSAVLLNTEDDDVKSHAAYCLMLLSPSRRGKLRFINIVICGYLELFQLRKSFHRLKR